jgi:UDP-2,3-diacylglucosamine pyrophosphatase LpxH
VAELVMNGDVVDFLQIAPFEPGPWRQAVGKLTKVFAAHRQTFDELARFVVAGNRLVVLVGNHDIELMFREVQATFIDGLGLPADARDRVHFPNDAPLDPRRFRGWTAGPFVYSLPGVHIEHGNQLDPLNYFDHERFYEDEATGMLRLPWGSRFVVSVFNEPATRYRFLDKVRSKTAAALILWTLDPQLAHDLLPGFKTLGPQLVQKLTQYYRSVGAPAGGGARAAESGSPEETALAEFGGVAQELATALRYPDAQTPEGARSEPALRAKLALLRRAVASDTTGDETRIDDEHTDQAFAIAEQIGASTVILGHTHGARDVTRGTKRYLNTGTWIELVNLDRLAAAVEASERDPWALVAAMLDPQTYQSAPRLSYVEIHEGGINLRVWTDQGAA